MGTSKLVALGATMLLVVAACSDSAESAPDSTDVAAGAVVPQTPQPTPPLYSPAGYDELLYALPQAISGQLLVDSPADVTEADENLLALDPRIRRALVDLGMGPDVIRIVQRGDTYQARPRISVTAVQFKGLPAEDYAHYVSSIYLLATSVTREQHRLTGAKPPLQTEEIEGRRVQSADWGEFDVVWYPHGDVIFIVLAENPQVLADALRALPPFDSAV